jgi:hypothetical protein
MPADLIGLTVWAAQLVAGLVCKLLLTRACGLVWSRVRRQRRAEPGTWVAVCSMNECRVREG